jgi:cyclic pyranopterin phosphate synthase
MEGYKEGIEKEELSLEEIALIREAAHRLGINVFKITGGEPTIRGDLAEIVRILHQHNGYVSMTTNASLLHRHLPRLAEAGLGHINVSLHAMTPGAFEKITGSKLLPRVLDNIRLAREYGMRVKINFVVLRGLNEQDIEKIIDFAADVGADVQFIELHPVGKASKVFRDHHLPRWRVLEKLDNRIVEIKYRLGLHNRPVLVLDNGVRVEIVGPVGNYLFCAACTRIRVTYDFKLIPCLNWRGAPVEVRPRLKDLESFEDKVMAVIDALREANTLREPYVKFPLKAPFTIPRRRWATARLGIPKKSGELGFTRSRSNLEELAAKEWGSYL